MVGKCLKALHAKHVIDIFDKKKSFYSSKWYFPLNLGVKAFKITKNRYRKQRNYFHKFDSDNK